MQLAPAPGSLRGRLGAAVCVLLAAGGGAAAHAEPAAQWQFDGSGLLYGEKSRTTVGEPIARIARQFSDGQSLAAQFGFDTITGASPTGALPSGQIQTVTTPSGNTKTVQAGQIPTTAFRDNRASLDLEWRRPVGTLFTATTSGHVSREKDYQSLGVDAQFSLDLMHRLTTVTGGAGYSDDNVYPVGGTPAGLSDPSDPMLPGSNSKGVATGMLGVSRILTRRTMVSLSGTRTVERGYLTEPYKVLSLVDGTTGFTTGELKEKRPDLRIRTSVLAGVVHHFAEDVGYGSYRYYQDDWGIRSHTLDFKYRRDFLEDRWVQPHLRLYAQSAADFFHFGLIDGQSLPSYASSDQRLGPLRTATIGLTYGFRVLPYPGSWSVRAEYLRQWGDGHPPEAVGVQKTLDLMPPVDIGSLLVGYSVTF
jgi:hypothetical protein